MISDSIETAVSAGVCAPMSRPAGPLIRSRSASSAPASSKRWRRRSWFRRERLRDEGVDEADLDRINGPAGLDIGAHTPAETAVSMLAEIMAVRAGRDGGRLKDTSGRIHAEIA